METHRSWEKYKIIFLLLRIQEQIGIRDFDSFLVLGFECVVWGPGRIEWAEVWGRGADEVEASDGGGAGTYE